MRVAACNIIHLHFVIYATACINTSIKLIYHLYLIKRQCSRDFVCYLLAIISTDYLDRNFLINLLQSSRGNPL